MPGIGRRATSVVENSEKSGARMYMRADVEIFLKGTAGQDANEGWGRTWGGEGGRDPESPWQRVHLQRAVSRRGMREKDRNG